MVQITVRAFFLLSFLNWYLCRTNLMLHCCLGNHHTNLRLYAKMFLLSVFSFHW